MSIVSEVYDACDSASKDNVFKVRLTVVGLGGAGSNAVSNMINANLEGVNFVVANTDAQSLALSPCTNKVQLGRLATAGLGAGAMPSVGQRAATESADELMNHIGDSSMVFITAGMGGGTGTGAAPVIAKMAKERGIITVAVVTKPFNFEGHRRIKIAEEGIAELEKHVDTLIVVANQNLFRIANESTGFADAFRIADDVLYSGVKCITDLITMPGLINLDFADIKTVMIDMGRAMIGSGEASGPDRATVAVEMAITNPLLENVSISGAEGLLINITGGTSMTLFEVNDVVNSICEKINRNTRLIFGSIFNESMGDVIRVSVVATGVDGKFSNRNNKANQHEDCNLQAQDVDEKTHQQSVAAYCESVDSSNSSSELDEDAKNTTNHIGIEAMNEDDESILHDQLQASDTELSAEFIQNKRLNQQFVDLEDEMIGDNDFISASPIRPNKRNATTIANRKYNSLHEEDLTPDNDIATTNSYSAARHSYCATEQELNNSRNNHTSHISEDMAVSESVSESVPLYSQDRNASSDTSIRIQAKFSRNDDDTDEQKKTDRGLLYRLGVAFHRKKASYEKKKIMKMNKKTNNEYASCNTFDQQDVDLAKNDFKPRNIQKNVTHTDQSSCHNVKKSFIMQNDRRMLKESNSIKNADDDCTILSVFGEKKYNNDIKCAD